MVSIIGSQVPAQIYSKECLEDQLLLQDHEIDEDLVQQGHSLMAILAEFHEKGGTFIRLDENGPQRALMFPNDSVFPACSAGFCRSQTLWALLKKFENKIALYPPHATRYGFDPYNGKMNWQRKRKIITFDEFELWAQMPKSIRMGFDVYGSHWDHKEATEEQLQQMLHYYNTHYYGPNTPSNRRVYFSFDKNTHAILHRLNQTNVNLSQVIVYHFPLQDFITHPLKQWETVPLSYKSYQQFSLILLNLIDTSKL